MKREQISEDTFVTFPSWKANEETRLRKEESPIPEHSAIACDEVAIR